MKIFQNFTVECISLIGTDVECKLVVIKIIVNLIINNQYVLVMGPYLLANLIVSKSLFGLVETGHKNLLHQLMLFGAKKHTLTKERQNIVMYLILLMEVEVETVPENLCPSIQKKVHRNKYDQSILLLSAPSKCLMCCTPMCHRQPESASHRSGRLVRKTFLR